MFGREPVLIASALIAIVQGVWMIAANDATISLIGWEAWLVPVLTMIGGWIGRRKVMPVETIKEAGLSPRAVKERAKDDAIPAHRGE